MFDEDKILENVNGYLKKLTLIINNNASFTIFGFKFIKKSRVDDIFCCIEGTFPKEYKDAIRRLGTHSFKGYNCYVELLDSFKRYKSLSSEHYMVKYNIALRQITVLRSSLKADLKKILKDNF